MNYDARSPFQHEDPQIRPPFTRQCCANDQRTTTSKPRLPLKMFVGPWYLDEFGNPTREIKALD